MVTHKGGKRLFLAPLGNEPQNVTAGCHCRQEEEKGSGLGKCSQLELLLHPQEPPAPWHGSRE